MESTPLFTDRNPPNPGGERRYATAEEVEAAAGALTNEDYTKLMLIATSFCKRRRLEPNVMEPKELLSEAVLRTLRLDKKWNKAVSFLKHLDRAMENISGHLVRELVRERNKMVAFPNGLAPEDTSNADTAQQVSHDETIATREEAETAIKAVFGDDDIAIRVFKRRVEGYEASEIQSQLCLTGTQYEAIVKRIRRKITKSFGA
jgi:hypothetical protein